MTIAASQSSLLLSCRWQESARLAIGGMLSGLSRKRVGQRLVVLHRLDITP